VAASASGRSSPQPQAALVLVPSTQATTVNNKKAGCVMRYPICQGSLGEISGNEETTIFSMVAETVSRLDLC
jgi:hypothetical protein